MGCPDPDHRLELEIGAVDPRGKLVLGQHSDPEQEEGDSGCSK